MSTRAAIAPIVLLLAGAAHAQSIPDFLQDPLPRRYALRARWKGGAAAATRGGPAIAATPSFAALQRTVALLDTAPKGKVRILDAGRYLTIALWVDAASLKPVGQQRFVSTGAGGGETGVWVDDAYPVATSGRRAMVGDEVVEAEIGATAAASRESPPLGEIPATENVLVAADTLLFDEPGGAPFGRVLLDSVHRRIREADGHVLVAYATDHFRVVGWIPIGAVRSDSPEWDPGHATGTMFAGRAIPAGTLVYDASRRQPIGLAREWIGVQVYRTRGEWSEVMLATELAARVWVRSDQIAHLR